MCNARVCASSKWWKCALRAVGVRNKPRGHTSLNRDAIQFAYDNVIVIWTALFYHKPNRSQPGVGFAHIIYTTHITSKSEVMLISARVTILGDVLIDAVTNHSNDGKQLNHRHIEWINFGGYVQVYTHSLFQQLNACFPPVAELKLNVPNRCLNLIQSQGLALTPAALNHHLPCPNSMEIEG